MRRSARRARNAVAQTAGSPATPADPATCVRDARLPLLDLVRVGIETEWQALEITAYLRAILDGLDQRADVSDECRLPRLEERRVRACDDPASRRGTVLRMGSNWDCGRARLEREAW